MVIAILRQRIREADEAWSGALHRCELGALDYVLVITGLCFGSHGMPFTLAVIWFFLGTRAGVAAICQLYSDGCCD